MIATATSNETASDDTGAIGAHILVVDDNLISRKKIMLSVRSLGHDTTLAENGMVALSKLREGAFDVVLLDLVMPEMDGFDVLKQLKADSQLSHIPVIVVTAYDEQTESVVKAIELGAEDVLPKDFNPVLLKARLDASLSKKRYRDQEIEYFRRVDALTGAAEVIESGRFSGDKLDLDRMAAEPDSLGRLAAVFKGMATEIYNRELKLHRSLHMLQGSFLVVLVGVVWGLSPALSRMLSGAGTNPLGLAIWINLIITTICFLVAAYRNKLPRLNRREVLFFLAWAVVAGVLQRLVTYWVSGQVEAAMISLIVTLQGFIVFAFAAITKLEKATPKRLLGLMIGLIGVALVLWSKFDMAAMKQSVWLLAATLLPLLFAIEAIVLAGRRPQHIDIFASVGFMTGFSALLLLPMAYFTDSLMPLGPSFGEAEVLTLILGIASTASILLAFRLIAVAGSVFYSQCAYTMTLAGIVWGMLLLDESLPAIAWVAFFLIVIGVYLVEPKPASDDIVIKRSFTGSRPDATDKRRASAGLDTRAWMGRLAPPAAVAAGAVFCMLLLNGLVGQRSGERDAVFALADKPNTGFNAYAGEVRAADGDTLVSLRAAMTDPRASASEISSLSAASLPVIKTDATAAPVTAADARYSSASLFDAVRADLSLYDDGEAAARDPLPLAVPTAAATVRPVEASHGLERELSAGFLFISEDDPFSELVVTSTASELMMLTPSSGTLWIDVAQGSRLTSLASNGEWFHARTEAGVVGYIPVADVIVQALQYAPVVGTSSTH